MVFYTPTTLLTILIEKCYSTRGEGAMSDFWVDIQRKHSTILS